MTKPIAITAALSFGLGVLLTLLASGGDGALGFWKALRKAFPTTREQRC